MRRRTRIYALIRWIAEDNLFKRQDQGSVFIDLPDASVKVSFDEDEPVVRTWVTEQSSSRRIVGEFMVLSNEVTAKFATENEIPAIYRVQEPPDFVPGKELESYPEGPAREFARLRKMRKGGISAQAAQHYGLGIMHYLQASSPIRRYSDLAMQRQFKAFFAGTPLPYTEAELFEIIGDVERATYEARLIQRESLRYWLIYVLSQRAPEEELDAIVLNYRDDEQTRATVMLTEFAFRVQTRLRHRPRVGESIRLVVERADARADMLVLKEVL